MTHAVSRALFGLVLACACAPALGQQPLPNLKVDLDDKPVELAPVMLELNTYLVPMRAAVALLTHDRGKVRILPGTTYDVMIDGQVRVRIPMTSKAGQSVEVFGSEGPPKAVRSIPVESYPYEITPKGGAPTTFVDAELLCSSLGVSMEVAGTQMSLLSPEYWCSKLGIESSHVGDRLLQNLDNLPDFGISPPARTILCWLRPTKASLVQAYRLEGSKAEPMLGESALGEPRDVLTPNDTPHMRAAAARQPLRFETYNYGDSLGQTVSFVSIVTSKDIGGKDPVRAINSGDLKEDEWAIVGLRQKVNDMPILFENRPVAPNEDVAAFSERNKNSPSIVRVLNGLRQGEKLSPGTKLCVMIGLDEDKIRSNQKSRYEFKGLYEVQQGDTLKTLAEGWGVTPDDILATNGSIPGGAEPQPGDLLNIISKKDGEPTKAAATTPAAQEDTSFVGSAATLSAVDVHETSKLESPVVGQIPKSKFIEILGKAPGDVYRVRFESLMGFVPGSALHLRDAAAAPTPPPGPDNDIVAREALKYVGTPYLWGGNSLSQGIDCSHFVAQVFERIGWKEPPPPVVVQETIGDIVHCKQGLARRGGQTIALPNPTRFRYATTDMRALRPGDRIIFQRGESDASGSRHTGIFIGHVPNSWRQRFGDIPYAFAHASSSRGVTVGSLTARYYWGIYKFSVRSQR